MYVLLSLNVEIYYCKIYYFQSKLLLSCTRLTQFNHRINEIGLFFYSRSKARSRTASDCRIIDVFILFIIIIIKIRIILSLLILLFRRIIFIILRIDDRRIIFFLQQTEGKKPYRFMYEIDGGPKLNYGHGEESDGHSTHGQYKVKLPDGRTQIVRKPFYLCRSIKLTDS